MSVWKEDVRHITQKGLPVDKSLRKPWYLLDLEGRLVEYWSKFMTLLLIYTALVTPYRIGFIPIDSLYWTYFEYCVSLVFFIDLVMNCVLPYYDSAKNLVVQPKKIFFTYFFSWFFPDLLACLPFALFLKSDKQYNSMIRVARLPRLYKLIKITKLLRVVKVMKHSSQILKQVNRLLRLSTSVERFFWFIFTYSFLIHLVACLWAFIGFYDDTSINWISIGNYSDKDNLDLYIISVYWTIATVSTVGYGDIVAENLNEKIFCISVMTLGIIFYSYSISSLTNLLSNVDLRQSKLNNQMFILDRITAEYKLNLKFYSEISQALEHNCNNAKSDIDELLIDLPRNLGNQLTIAVYEKQITNNVFFDQRTTMFVAWVAQRLNFFKCKANNTIYSRGDRADQMYFIITGSVEFLLEENKEKLPFLQLEKDYFFGEIDLIYSEHKNRTFSVRSMSDCEMLVLSRENFNLMLENFLEEGLEIIENIKKRSLRVNADYIEALESIKTQSFLQPRRSEPLRDMEKFGNSAKEEFMKHPRKKNMFKKIFEEKRNVKEQRIKKIMLQISALEKIVRETRDLADCTQVKMVYKYPEYREKYCPHV